MKHILNLNLTQKFINKVIFIEIKIIIFKTYFNIKAKYNAFNINNKFINYYIIEYYTKEFDIDINNL